MITKINFFSLIFAFIFIGLISCKTSQLKSSSTAKTGMFKVAILYPNGEDKTFDMDYYEKKHMPMVAGFLGKNILGSGVDFDLYSHLGAGHHCRAHCGDRPGVSVNSVAVGGDHPARVLAWRSGV